MGISKKMDKEVKECKLLCLKLKYHYRKQWCIQEGFGGQIPSSLEISSFIKVF